MQRKAQASRAGRRRSSGAVQRASASTSCRAGGSPARRERVRRLVEVRRLVQHPSREGESGETMSKFISATRPLRANPSRQTRASARSEHTAVEKRCAKKKSASTRPRANSAVLTSGSIKSPSPPANTVASSRHCATSSGQWTCGMRSSALTLACSRAGAAQGRHPATRRPRWQIADPGPLTRAPWQGHQPAARSCLREYIAVQCGGSIRRRWSAWVGARRAATTRPTSSHPGMLAAAPARPRDERLALGALTSLNSIGEGAIEGGDALVSEHAASPCRRFHGRGTSARGWLSNCPGRCGGRLLHPAASRAGGRRFRLPLPMTPHLSAPGPLRRASMFLSATRVASRSSQTGKFPHCRVCVSRTPSMTGISKIIISKHIECV